MIYVPPTIFNSFSFPLKTRILIRGKTVIEKVLKLLYQPNWVPAPNQVGHRWINIICCKHGSINMLISKQQSSNVWEHVWEHTQSSIRCINKVILYWVSFLWRGPSLSFEYPVMWDFLLLSASSLPSCLADFSVVFCKLGGHLSSGETLVS